MKLRISLAALVCALVALPVVRAEDAPKQDQTELGARMEKMSGALRKLKASVKDATKNEDSLAQVAILEQNATEALKFEPAKKGIVVADYQAKIKVLIGHLGEVKAALKAGKNDEAAAALDLVSKDQSEGHKEFKQGKKKA